MGTIYRITSEDILQAARDGLNAACTVFDAVDHAGGPLPYARDVIGYTSESERTAFVLAYLSGVTA